MIRAVAAAVGATVGILRGRHSAATACAPTPGPDTDVLHWRLHLAYDGADYFGWQRQPGNVQTVQAEVDRVLSNVFRTEVLTVGSSRTDRGVHARGQVCHFSTPDRWGGEAPGLDPTVALRRLRRALPAAVLAVALGRTVPAFHARLSAVRKRYSYRLVQTSVASPFDARYCWPCGPLDVHAMDVAASALSGQRLSYSAFTVGEPEPSYHGSVEKMLEVSVQRVGKDGATVLLVCDRFLYRMARRVVGALVQVGRGKLPPERVLSLDRSDVPTAPPEGLCLEQVEYPATFPVPVAMPL
mmetsp:Transcript_22379/g.46370  ORF Transcript_22379/g.46370 Transcript_22379/m.46370 type:complete len:298 (-) Transcript_22379:5-898(-)